MQGALNEVRNEIAKAKFSKPFEFLTYDQQKEIRALYPLIIGEAHNSNEKFLYDFFKKEKTSSISN